MNRKPHPQGNGRGDPRVASQPRRFSESVFSNPRSIAENHRGYPLFQGSGTPIPNLDRGLGPHSAPWDTLQTPVAWPAHREIELTSGPRHGVNMVDLPQRGKASICRKTRVRNVGLGTCLPGFVALESSFMRRGGVRGSWRRACGIGRGFDAQSRRPGSLNRM